MKPDWDKLMNDFADKPGALVADVNCEAAGRSLCDRYNVRGYPTIRYGNPDKMQEYHGDRTYDDMFYFAEKNLKPREDTAAQRLRLFLSVARKELLAFRLETKEVTRNHRNVVIALLVVGFVTGIWLGIVTTLNCCMRKRPAQKVVYLTPKEWAKQE